MKKIKYCLVFTIFAFFIFGSVKVPCTPGAQAQKKDMFPKQKVTEFKKIVTPVTIKKNVVFRPSTLTFIPPHIKGDRDFHGNGPKVDCTVRLIKSKYEITARIYMHARDTKSDWTAARGSKVYLIYKAPAGWKILRHLSPTMDSIKYTDSNHAKDEFNRGNYGLVNKFTFIGDTYGNESGTKTRVTVIFNNVKIISK